MTKTKTLTNTFRDYLQRMVLETSDLWDTWSEWWGDITSPKTNDQRQRLRQRLGQRLDMACELVWSYWHFRQLRTWIHNNHLNLTIKIDTGQHLQFLQCFELLIQLYRNLNDKNRRCFKISSSNMGMGDEKSIFEIFYLELAVTLKEGKGEHFETITFLKRLLASWR